MERSVLDITLDLQRPNLPGTITVNRGDTHRTLRFYLSDGARPYPVANLRAVLTATKPDGNYLFNDCALEGDRIVYHLTPQTTACPGPVECQLRLYGGEGELLNTAAFTISVEDTVYSGDEVITSAGEVSALTKLVTEADEKLARMDTVLAEKSKQYELIEKVTLEENVATFKRTADTKGVPYDFSAFRIRVQTAEAARSAQIIFNIKKKDGSSMIHHQQPEALATSEKATNLVLRNDHGLVDYYCVTSGSLNTNSPLLRDGYVNLEWGNVATVTLSTYPSAVGIPVGTVITIYGIRG
jgi:hypothetical protein